jgi:hypothetical protein
MYNILYKRYHITCTTYFTSSTLSRHNLYITHLSCLQLLTCFIRLLRSNLQWRRYAHHNLTTLDMYINALHNVHFAISPCLVYINQAIIWWAYSKYAYTKWWCISQACKTIWQLQAQDSIRDQVPTPRLKKFHIHTANDTLHKLVNTLAKCFMKPPWSTHHNPKYEFYNSSRYIQAQNVS